MSESSWWNTSSLSGIQTAQLWKPARRRSSWITVAPQTVHASAASWRPGVSRWSTRAKKTGKGASAVRILAASRRAAELSRRRYLCLTARRASHTFVGLLWATIFLAVGLLHRKGPIGSVRQSSAQLRGGRQSHPTPVLSAASRTLSKRKEKKNCIPYHSTRIPLRLESARAGMTLEPE